MGARPPLPSRSEIESIASHESYNTIVGEIAEVAVSPQGQAEVFEQPRA